MENPIRMDDLGVPPFKETPIWILWVKESPQKKNRLGKGKKKQREDTREMTPLKEWHRVDAIKIW